MSDVHVGLSLARRAAHVRSHGEVHQRVVENAGHPFLRVTQLTLTAAGRVGAVDKCRFAVIVILIIIGAVGTAVAVVIVIKGETESAGRVREVDTSSTDGCGDEVFGRKRASRTGRDYQRNVTQQRSGADAGQHGHNIFNRKKINKNS